MQHKNSSITSVASPLFSIVLIMAVLLSSLHAKDLIKTGDAIGKIAANATDESRLKIGHELHNHVDKVSLKAFSGSGDMQTDARSLRMTHIAQRRQALNLLPLIMISWLAQIKRLFML